MRIDTQPPQRDVDIVHAVISDITTAKVVPPAPHAVQQIGTPRHDRCRTKPRVKIQGLGWCSRLGFSNRATTLAVPCFRDEHFTDLAVSDMADTIFHTLRAATLSPHLQSLSTTFDGFRQESPFPDIVAAGLFDINVLAGIERQDCRRSVPMIGRRNEHRIDRRVSKNLA